MQEHNTRGRSEGCGGGGLPVVGLGLAVLMGLSCIACSSSGLTEATDGTGQPEVWEVKANDIKVADGFADLLDLRGDVAGFDVWVAPEVCADRNAGPWCPCDTNTDCLSGWCVFHFGDKVCSKTCVEECPEGWSCEPAPGPDPVSVCRSLYPALCLPCTSTDQCANAGGGKTAKRGQDLTLDTY